MSASRQCRWWTLRRRGRRALAGLVPLVLLPACGSGTVRISYRPAVGAVAVYRTSVRAVTVTSIGDEVPRRRVTSSALTAHHRVLESGPDGTRVEVRLHEQGVPDATFVVRFGRAGQLSEVQRIEGVPADVLGGLGVSEIFPAGAAAPPARPLAPGDRWAVDGPVRLADAGPSTARLAGHGRLVALAVAAGKSLARVDTDYRLPVRRTAADTGGRLALEGTLATRARVDYDLDDHEVDTVTARTTGRYAVTLLPPPGVSGVPVPGTLDVDVWSTSRRIA
ncbi:MAG TPA: hypothetical protein VHM89_08705 [Acidimicrobiales bacterium]|nr:hypothetical protein [Acidimicrobiales bacterium]